MPIDFNTITTPEELYTLVDPESGQHITFAVARLRKSIKVKLLPDVLVPLDFEYGAALLEAGLDGQRLQAHINMRTLPAVLMLRREKMDALIDGEYAYCAALARGQREVLAKRIPMSVWQEFIVTNVPYTREQLERIAKQGGPKSRLN